MTNYILYRIFAQDVGRSGYILSTQHGVPEIGAVVAALCASLTAAKWTEGR